MLLPFLNPEVELTIAHTSATMSDTVGGAGPPDPQRSERERMAVGLFGMFRKKEPEKAPPAAESRPVVYSGMRVEVAKPDGRILFAGKLMDYRGNQAKLYQFIEIDVDIGEEPVEVKIRGYNDKTRMAVYMNALIFPQPNHVWQVEKLVVEREENDRAFFRLELDTEATVTTFGGFGSGEYVCRLVNISVGGVCIRTDYAHQKGDKFLLRVQLLEDRDFSTMYCQVVRVTPREQGGFEYGCRFLELTEKDETRITQNIFEFQRKKRSV